MKNKKLLTIIIGVVIAIGLGLVVFYTSGIGAVSSSEEKVVVVVDKGKGSSQILNVLDDAGLVKNKLAAKIFLKLNKYDHIQANTYVFSQSMSLKNMYDVMENPTAEYLSNKKFTIIDGQSASNVAASIAEILEISKDDVLKKWKDKTYLKSLIDQYWFIDEKILNNNLMYSLEGYLYPETYFVYGENNTIESLTKLGLDMMDQKLSPHKDRIKDLGWSAHEFLSFVSVVQRETLFDKDLSKIAGVFMNRLRINMALQSDITVNYAWQRTGVDVSIKHTQIDSPYNTYKYPGLPVGPICNINEKAMLACLNYEKNDYLFFFAKADGEVIYTKTYNEHLKAVKENKWY